tara:strand:- start:157 stop:405 length:249 start_codon:yes stop_codon:yes gene_type:complete
MEMIGEEVKHIRETNKNKIKFNSMMNAYNLHNEDLRDSIVDLEEEHMTTYILYYRNINQTDFIKSANAKWLDNPNIINWLNN